MIKAGVIGHPISHSKSPFIHGYWLKEYGINGEYKTYDVNPDNFDADIRALIDAGLRGFNVTIPHKQKIMSLCKTLSDEARLIGAVNTVTISDEGVLHGHNTDAFGFAQNLKEAIAHMDWTNLTATVLGAGGAARAIMYALKQNGVKDIRITNRTKENAEQLAALYDATVIDWDDKNKSLTGCNLLINTTSLGMKGQQELDIDISAMDHDAIVYDIVYTPLMTSLLQQAEQNGFRVVTGIGMLLHQARPGFEAWFGRFPSVPKDLEELILTKK